MLAPREGSGIFAAARFRPVMSSPLPPRSAVSAKRGWLFPVTLTASVGVALLLAAGLELRRSRDEAALLREENAALSSLAAAVPVSAESEEPDTTQVPAASPAELELPVSAPPEHAEAVTRVHELEEVIVFLRGEIQAARETIERLKAERR